MIHRSMSPGCPGGNGAIGGQGESSPIFKPVQDSSTGPLLSRSDRSRREFPWKEFFADPSQCLGNAKSKSLLIGGVHDESVMKGMPEQSSAMRRKGIGCQAWSDPADVALAEGKEHRPSFTSEEQTDATRSQLDQHSDWETLSAEDALARLERMTELPSVGTFICIAQKCRKEKKLCYAERLYMHVCNIGLEAETVLGNYLVPMLSECGSMSKAQQVFDRLVNGNEQSCTSLMRGYIQCGDSQRALDLFQKMQDSRMHPSKYTFVALLKACARLKCLERGQEIHDRIVNRRCESEIFVGSTLVDMYAKCGSLAEAQDVFDKLPVRNVVSFNSMIAAFAEHGLGKEALNCLEKMQLDDISPDAVTFVCSLKACGGICAIKRGQRLHTEIAKHGFERELFVGNALVDMYVKFGYLAEAQEVFDALPDRDIVSWNALIAGYIEHHFCEEALHCLEQMRLERVSPNSATYVCSLKAFGSIGAIEKGREVITQITKEGYERYTFVCNTLVDMYAKCCLLAEAQEMFDRLSVRDVVSWTALIAGYVEQGLCEEALDCLKEMRSEGVSPNAITMVCSLKACGSLVSIDRGREMHIEITKEGHERNRSVGNTLVNMYAKCGLLAEAREVIGSLSVRDVVSWTALIAGYTDHGLGEEALNCLEQMKLEGVSPNVVTFTCSLKACSSIGAIDKGREIHAQIAKEGFQRDPFVASALVDMYAKCHSIVKAREVFDELPVRDVVSWNALISGYTEHGLGKEALKCLEWMQLEGVSPNAVTLVSSLKACCTAEAIDTAREIHAKIAKEGFEADPVVGNTLVHIYCKSGSLAEAWEVFDKLPARDVVSWNALIAGYAEFGLNEEASNCFEQMNLDGVSPNVVSWNTMIFGYGEQGDSEKAFKLYTRMQEQGLLPNRVTFASMLKACGTTAALETGKKIHAQIYRVGGLDALCETLATALIDMYGKCGSMVYAQQVFDAMPTNDLVTWNALITGYARQGESDLVFCLFERMRKKGIQPDGITFLSVLAVCAHVGLMNRGQKYFEAMITDYGITPSIKHHNCMVDLLGRAGELKDVFSSLEKTPLQPDCAMWNTLLIACQRLGDVDLGRQAFAHMMRLEEAHGGAFILMSNIYADALM